MYQHVSLPPPGLDRIRLPSVNERHTFFRVLSDEARFPPLPGPCCFACALTRLPSFKASVTFGHDPRLPRYQEDPLSEGSPTNAIAARYDLDPERESAAAANWTRRAFGAVDAKVNLTTIALRTCARRVP